MTDKILLSIKNLTIKIGAQIILSNISLDIKKNQVLGLVGESGSGKSFTALSIFCLLYTSDAADE